MEPHVQWVCAWHAPHLTHGGVWWGQLQGKHWGSTTAGSTAPATAQDESSDTFPTTRLPGV